jgi:hypothetical protein
MPTAAEEAFRAELVAEFSEINDLAGLEKYTMIPQEHPETAASIRLRQEAIGRRVQLINKTLEAMDALDQDGYPGIPISEVSKAIYQDLQNDAEDLLSALKGFTLEPPPATGLRGRFGLPEPKEGTV